MKKFCFWWMVFALLGTVLMHYVPETATWANNQVATVNTWFATLAPWTRTVVDTTRPVFEAMSKPIPGFWHGALLSAWWMVVIHIAKKS